MPAPARGGTVGYARVASPLADDRAAADARLQSTRWPGRALNGTMSLLHPVPHAPSTGHKVAGVALLAGAALLLVGAGLALGTQQSYAPAVDPCAMPAGTSIDTLGSRDATLVTRRLLACNDLRFGRITGGEYAAAIAALDKQWQSEPE